MKVFFILLSFLVIYCDDSHDIPLQETEKAEIDNLKMEIKEMAAASICSEDFSCKSAGFGAKPCGGNWEYIIYSNSIDEDVFLAKIASLNRLEQSYNDKYGIISDCSVAMPPSSITCEDGKCTGIFQ